MPFVGLGLHFLVALFFAVHAVRTGREMYWLLILFSFPILGSVVYFFAIYLPQSRLEHTIGKAGKVVRNTLDPGRALREAQRDFDLAPTAHNQVRLASALLNAGQVKQAVEQFDACLRGPFADDSEIVMAGAQAQLAYGNPEVAIAMLDGLRRKKPGFRPEQVALALAKAHAAAGLHEQAGVEFAHVVEHHDGIEGRVEYALWAIERNERDLAAAQMKEVNHSRKHMTTYTRSLHRDLFRRLDAALEREQARQALRDAVQTRPMGGRAAGRDASSGINQH